MANSVDSPISVTRAELIAQRAEVAADDVHFCESLAAEIIERFSEPGDSVVDPFAGYGTTLLVAARLGRRPVGVELLPERARVIADRIGSTGVVLQGDARAVAEQAAAGASLCLTSPPYMSSSGHPENPLTGYTTLDGDYPRYVAELGELFTRLLYAMRRGSHLVINVADPVGPDGATPLVEDLRSALSRRLRLVHSISVAWDEPPHGFVNDACLVYASGEQKVSGHDGGSDG